MAYTAGSFTAFEQPTTAKWNQLWDNDASLRDGTGVLWNNNQAINAKNSGGTSRQVVKRNSSNVLEIGDSTQATGVLFNEIWTSTVQPYALVTTNVNQSISNNTNTTLAFASEISDGNAMHDTASNNSRITIPKSGIYLISANITWAANGSGQRYVGVLINGSISSALQNIVFPVGGAVDVTIQTVTFPPYSLAAGDYIEIRVFQVSGGSLNVNSGSNFGVFKLA